MEEVNDVTHAKLRLRDLSSSSNDWPRPDKVGLQAYTEFANRIGADLHEAKRQYSLLYYNRDNPNVHRELEWVASRHVVARLKGTT